MSYTGLKTLRCFDSTERKELRITLEEEPLIRQGNKRFPFSCSEVQ